MSGQDTDPVTGLPWIDALHECFLSDHFESRSGKTGLVVFDVDGSGAFAERHGPESVDALVCHVIEALGGVRGDGWQMFRFREDQTLEGMCPGVRDEFAIEVFDADVAPLGEFARGLNARLAESPLTITAGGSPVEEVVTLSVGHAIFPNVGTDIGELLQKTWRCVLRSKESGGGAVTECEEDEHF